MVYQSKNFLLLRGVFIPHIFQNQNFSLNKGGGFIKGGVFIKRPSVPVHERHTVKATQTGALQNHQPDLPVGETHTIPVILTLDITCRGCVL